MNVIKSAPLFIVLLALAACASANPPKYNWGNYPSALVTMDNDPSTASSYVQSLAKIVNDPAGKVPPGIFAEYGYMLQKQNDDKDAAAMYAREKSAWPESAALMDKMISHLQGTSGNAGKPVS